MLFTNKQLGNFAKDPAVVRYQDRYYLYYTIKYNHEAFGAPEKIGIGIAQSRDLEEWEEAGELPLEDACEKNGVGAPGAVVLDGRVHLFYQTYGNGAKDALCHAVSEDGLHFVKDKTNPVYQPEATWCCGRAIDADVCVFKDKLLLYYATRDHAMRVQMLGGAYTSLHSDFSKNCWTPLADETLLSPELDWEGECIEAPAVIENEGRLFLFYGGAYNCSPQQIGCAVSDDGIRFTRLSDQPFLPNGAAGEWNSSESGHPYVFRDDGGRVYLFYQGSADGGRTFYLSKKEIWFDADNLPHLK